MWRPLLGGARSEVFHGTFPAKRVVLMGLECAAARFVFDSGWKLPYLGRLGAAVFFGA